MIRLELQSKFNARYFNSLHWQIVVTFDGTRTKKVDFVFSHPFTIDDDLTIDPDFIITSAYLPTFVGPDLRLFI